MNHSGTLLTTNEEYVRLAGQHLMTTYNPLPLALVRGEGSYVWDVEGRRYLDWTSGVAVNNLGHCHPEIVSALQSQAATLIHCSNLYTIPEQALLAQKLTARTFADKIFVCNSGTEAIEGAIKIARLYGHQKKGEGTHEIICMHNSFHGRTLGALSATGQARYQKGFGPLLAGFRFVRFGALQELEAAIGESTIAVLVEPIQGEGGVHLAPEGYLAGIRKLCDRHHLLMIADEVQVGIGRVGHWLASQHWSVEPDLATLAKGLGSGFPIGAILAAGKVADLLTPGDHASTFGGNPLACRVALATLKVMEEAKILPRVRSWQDVFERQLRQLKSRYPVIHEVRGLGLIWALELGQDLGEKIRQGCLAHGLLINVIKDKILRLLPSLLVSEAEIDEGLTILDVVLSQGKRWLKK